MLSVGKEAEGVGSSGWVGTAVEDVGSICGVGASVIVDVEIPDTLP